MKINSKDFRVQSGKKVKLAKWPTIVKPFCKSKEEYQELLEKHVEELSSLQQLHYASNHYALLLIFQGMDGAGKDGAIRHVMSGVNPQGCEVFSFKQPSAEELEHDFLWRTTLPPSGTRADRHLQSFLLRGSAGGSSASRDSPQPGTSRRVCATRNRSGRSATAPSWIWRSTSIATERGSSKYFSTFPRKSSESDSSPASMSPTRTGNSALRTFTRGNTGSITWKRMRTCLHATSTHHAPWYVVPADDKENARLIVSRIVLDALEDLKMAYPKTTAKRRAGIAVDPQAAGKVTSESHSLACQHHREVREEQSICLRKSKYHSSIRTAVQYHRTRALTKQQRAG